jgi:hypothetical protein
VHPVAIRFRTGRMIRKASRESPITLFSCSLQHHEIVPFQSKQASLWQNRILSFPFTFTRKPQLQSSRLFTQLVSGQVRLCTPSVMFSLLSKPSARFATCWTRLASHRPRVHDYDGTKLRRASGEPAGKESLPRSWHPSLKQRIAYTNGQLGKNDGAAGRRSFGRATDCEPVLEGEVPLGGCRRHQQSPNSSAN